MKKTKLLFGFLVLFLLTINVSCDKASGPLEVIPPVVTPVVVVTDAYASPISIPYAGSTTIYWTSKNIMTVKLNGAPVSSTNGSENMVLLTKDTSVMIEFVDATGKIITKYVQVLVGPKPVDVIIPTKLDTMTNLITSAPWKIKRFVSLYQNEWTADWSISTTEANMRMTFNKNGDYIITFTDDPVWISKSKWNFSADLKYLTFGGITDSIVNLTDKELTVQFMLKATGPNNTIVDFALSRKIYEH